MRAFRCPAACVLVGFLTLVMGWTSVAWSQNASKPLSEQDLTTLLSVGLEDAVIVGRIEKAGLAFATDTAAIERLKQAGASPAVQAAVKKAGESKPAAAPAQAITYADIVKLLDLGIDAKSIIKRLEASPTVFTLDLAQIAELKGKGATDELIQALSQPRVSPAAATKEISDLVLILDCSNSMLEQTVDGVTKMELAKKVVTDIIRKIPQGLHVAFIVYGHDVSLGCKAVKVARPLSELDTAGREELVKLIATLQPSGHTPIALALETAGQELSRSTANCGIVLVTDGMESCHGKPDEVAALLAKNPRLTFGVNVIGLGLKPEEQTAIKSLAARGEYYDAQNAGQFAQAFATLLKPIVVVPKVEVASNEPINLAAKKNGGYFAERPADRDDAPAENLLDGTAKCYRSQGVGATSFVLGFKNDQPVQISAIGVNPSSPGSNSDWVREVEVEISETSPIMGFKKLGKFEVPVLSEDAIVPITPPQTARYVRFRFLKNNNGTWFDVNEVMVYGKFAEAAATPVKFTNVAAASAGGKVLSVSSLRDNSDLERGDNLIDGTVNKGWSSESRNPQTVVLQLGTPSRVSHVVINPYRAGSPSDWAKTAEILLSDTDTITGFKSVGTLEMEQVGQDHVFALPEPTAAKFVKIRFMDNHFGTWMGAAEVKVLTPVR